MSCFCTFFFFCSLYHLNDVDFFCLGMIVSHTVNTAAILWDGAGPSGMITCVCGVWKPCLFVEWKAGACCFLGWDGECSGYSLLIPWRALCSAVFLIDAIFLPFVQPWVSKRQFCLSSYSFSFMQYALTTVFPSSIFFFPRVLSSFMSTYTVRVIGKEGALLGYLNMLWTPSLHVC